MKARQSPVVTRLRRLRESGLLPAEFTVATAIEVLNDVLRPRAIPGKSKLTSQLRLDPRIACLGDVAPDTWGVERIGLYAFNDERGPF